MSPMCQVWWPETSQLGRFNGFSTHKKMISEDNVIEESCDFKGALSGLRKVVVTENLLKMMKNAFYFASKALFVLKIFHALS